MSDRRAFLSIVGAGAWLAACRRETARAERTSAGPGAGDAPAASTRAKAPEDQDHGEDVSATEDLMREHGVIRRVLIVYREASARLRVKPASVPPTRCRRRRR